MVGERRYSAAVRAEVVRLARSGRRVEDLSVEFGPAPSTIRLWLRTHLDEHSAAQDVGLHVTHPELAGQLEPARNPDVDPAVLTAGSNRKLWWRCPAGHVWQARVYSRAAGAGCPVCAGHYPAGIATTHPDLAAQLDPHRNPDIDPLDVGVRFVFGGDGHGFGHDGSISVQSGVIRTNHPTRRPVGWARPLR